MANAVANMTNADDVRVDAYYGYAKYQKAQSEFIKNKSVPGAEPVIADDRKRRHDETW